VVILRVHLIFNLLPEDTEDDEEHKEAAESGN
jgi:hypothetical protein